MTDLRQNILDALTSDDSFTTGNNINIAKVYFSLDTDSMEKVDSIFINLCGYSLMTLLVTEK